MVIEKDVQKRILRAMRNHSADVTISIIGTLTGLGYDSSRNGLNHLTNRSLIFKTIDFVKAKSKVPPHQHNTFSLNSKRLEKIDKLISQIGRDD